MSQTMKIKKGDVVHVLRGKDAGKEGRVVESMPKEGRVVVENINVIKKHRRPRPIRNTTGMGGSVVPGGIIDLPAPLPVSNVMLVCPSCGKPTRVGTIEKTIAGTVHQFQPVVAVEREHRDIDFFHHGAKKRGGFQGAQTLFPQRLAERIDLDHHFAHGVVGAGTASTQGEIFFAHGGEEIGKRLKRENDAVAKSHGETDPGRQDKEGECPRRLRRIRTEPQKQESNDRAGKPRGQGEKLNSSFVSELLHSRLNFSRRR